MQNCLTTNVDTYLRNGCPQLVLESGNAEYWSSLFSLFYGDKPDLYITGDNLYFQDLLAEMSTDTRVGRFTSSQWSSRCPLTKTVDNNPYINKICGCYSNYGPCNSNCNEFAIPPITSTGVVQTCPKNICRIDNLAIYAQNSTLGNIYLDQLCPFCLSPSSCICQINNLSVHLESSSIGNIHLNQLCDPVLSSVNGLSPSAAVNEYHNNVSSKDQINNSMIKTWLLAILSIITLVLIFVMIVLVAKQPKNIIDVPISPQVYALYQQNT
jgi:hypothetical protein